jgi:hypothetical protein
VTDARGGSHRSLDTPRQIVSKWRKRFCTQRLPGLEEQPRGGRPARFRPSVVVEVKALACGLLGRRGVPLARWSLADLRREVVAHGLVAQISGTTLWQWLSQGALRPWRHRSWIFSPDSEFAAKAGRILDLYERRWQGLALGRATTCSAPTRRQASRCVGATMRPAVPAGRCMSSTEVVAAPSMSYLDLGRRAARGTPDPLPPATTRLESFGRLCYKLPERGETW